jgi:nucleoside-diphosphate-sugar epimerase
MKVLVTGGAGRVGLPIVAQLVAAGHDVTAAGRSEGKVVPDARYESLDVTDADAVRALVGEHERVIHLAAIPCPGRSPDAELMHINVQGTYCVLEACAACGVDHVSIASSINALGQKFGRQPWPVAYLPIDEDHPRLATDAYSLSKQMTEEVARYFWERDRLSSICLRIPGVLGSRWASRLVERGREGVSGFFARDFWAYIDERDSASAFVRACEPCYEGAHACFVNDPWNIAGLPSRELAAIYYPGVSDWRAEVEGDETLVSPARFMALTGWEPAHTWRGMFDGVPVS